MEAIRKDAFVSVEFKLVRPEALHVGPAEEEESKVRESLQEGTRIASVVIRKERGKWASVSGHSNEGEERREKTAIAKGEKGRCLLYNTRY